MNRATELQFIAHMPQELLDTLLELLRATPHGEQDEMVLLLRPAVCDGELCQEVQRKTGNLVEIDRLRGFQPVEACILAHYSGGGWTMELLDCKCA